jgi:hypothetical protein
MDPQLHWMFSSMERVVGPAGDGGDPGEVHAAFGRYLDRLRDTAGLIDRPGMPAGPIDRADGYRNILMTLHFAMDRLYGEADPRAPAFGQPWPAHLFDWGGAAPDSVYRSAKLTGGVTYRISGNLGNSPSLSLQFFDGGDICLTLGREQLRPDASGEIEVLVGGEARGGAWFGLPPGVTALLLRQFFADWEAARPAKLRIEALDAGPGDWPRLSPERMARELDALGAWVRLTSQFWADRLVEGFRTHPNTFTDFVARGDVPALSWGYFDVPPGQAWIMEMPVPDSPYWSVQPGTIWFRTLDYANRQSSLNCAQAAKDADGVFRAVFSHEDPGVANWIDLQGLRRGAALVRIAAPRSDLATPTGRMVALGEVAGALPLAVRMDAAGRRAQIETRRRQVTRLLLE